jgi:hypothetical protein
MARSLQGARHGFSVDQCRRPRADILLNGYVGREGPGPATKHVANTLQDGIVLGYRLDGARMAGFFKWLAVPLTIVPLTVFAGAGQIDGFSFIKFGMSRIEVETALMAQNIKYTKDFTSANTGYSPQYVFSTYLIGDYAWNVKVYFEKEKVNQIVVNANQFEPGYDSIDAQRCHELKPKVIDAITQKYTSPKNSVDQYGITNYEWRSGTRSINFSVREKGGFCDFFWVVYYDEALSDHF